MFARTSVLLSCDALDVARGRDWRVFINVGVDKTLLLVWAFIECAEKRGWAAFSTSAGQHFIVARGERRARGWLTAQEDYIL